MGWTDERTEQLKDLWAEGLSGSQIARLLGGVSRCAVIAKADRLGLADRSHGSRVVRPRRAIPRANAIAQIIEAPPPVLEPEPIVRANGLQITTETLGAGECRFPIGDPVEIGFHYCGQECSRRALYCEYHKKMTHLPPPQPRKPTDGRRSITGARY